jgi:predicted site-specific integrase-resolvase
LFVWVHGTNDLGREIIMKRVALYIRVSTSKQDTDNQRRELSAVAERSGWEIWKIYEDAASAVPRAGINVRRLTP